MKKVYQVEKDNYEDAGKVSTDIKRTLKSIGIDRIVLKAVAIACYEAEMNIVIHSDGGTVTFEIDDEGLIQLLFDDIGPGISSKARLFNRFCKSTITGIWCRYGII